MGFEPIFGALLLLTSSGTTTEIPPPAPPAAELEFFNPTERTHSVEARCTGSVARILWTYDGQRARVTEFTFDNVPLVPEDSALVDGWASEMGRDFFVWIECGNRLATVSFVQAQLAGTSAAKRITFDLIDGRIRNVRRRG